MLNKIVAGSADPLRARHYWDLLAATQAGALLEKYSGDQARLLVAVLAGSRIFGDTLAARPDWVADLEIERLRFSRRDQGLRSELAERLAPALRGGDFTAATVCLREFKSREWLRIGARDLARLGNAAQITGELSDVADVCLEGLYQICHARLVARHGRPWHQDSAGRWQSTGFSLIGVGRLGGRELSYRPEVDLLFLYTAEGQVFKSRPAPGKSPRATLSNHQFFTELAGVFSAESSQVTPQGILFRINSGLRPEGEAGPLCRSLEGYENYYSQWGQVWERLMLIKARPVAGETGLAAEFLEMIQAFRYPRAIGPEVLSEMGSLKNRIETGPPPSGGRERNVYLGRGGLREIEFIAQTQQLLQGGRQPFLQSPQTVATLEKLARYRLLSHEDTWALRDACFFLRDVEHRLQLDGDLENESIPEEPVDCLRLARQMGVNSAVEFEALRSAHTSGVRRVLDRLIKSEPMPAGGGLFPPRFSGEESRWKEFLAGHSFCRPEQAMRTLREFVEGPGHAHVSARTTELAYLLLPRLFALCPRPSISSGPVPAKALSDPDRVVERLGEFLTAYGTRSVLFELWYRNASVFELLVLLFDRSEFLAEQAIRTPDLVDELVVSGRLRQRKTADETLRDLRHGLADSNQRLWLRRYHQAELMRIGLRDILGLAEEEQYLIELTALAEACLRYALEVVMQTHHCSSAPFAVLGLGRLAGGELDYGSDLEVLFVAPDSAPHLTALDRFARELLGLLSERTEWGLVFNTKARVWTQGGQEHMVQTLSACRDYYFHHAPLEEIQALTRSRAVAGDLELGESFQTLSAEVTGLQNPGAPLPLRFPDWKRQMNDARGRIERERFQTGWDEGAIQTGRGGLMDAEFVAQSLCLQHGWHDSGTLRVLERACAAGVLPEAQRLIGPYRRLRRVEGVLRRWSYQGETVLPEDPAPFYRVAVRCGFARPEEFRQSLARWRGEIRAVYEIFFKDAAAGASPRKKTPRRPPRR